jgi:molybdenum cofactor biosynthesis enzyme MoaA
MRRKFMKFAVLRDMVLKLKQQSPEKAENVYKSAKAFVKLFKAMKKGKTEKIEKYQKKLVGYLPEENKQLFEGIFDSIPQDLPKHELKERLFTVGKMFYQIYSPENINLFEDLEQMKRDRKQRKQFFRHMIKDRRDRSDEERPFTHEQKRELKEKYGKPVFKTAVMMKFQLPNEDLVKLCDYVKEAPVELTFEELMANYKA